MLGLMIVPIIAPVGRDIRARVPATPKPGPRYRSANAGGRSRSTSRMAASSLSSKRFPATAASRFGSDGPKFVEREPQPQPCAPPVGGIADRPGQR